MKKKNFTFDYSSETFNAYQASLNKKARLTAEEERALGESIRQGDTRARNKLVEANLLFVMKCADKFRSYSVPVEELITAGNEALVASADRYDPAYENRFLSYAVHNILQSMYDAVNEYRNVVHIPTNKVKEVAHYYESLDYFGYNQHDDDDDNGICLQNKLSSEPTTFQTEMLKEEEYEELRSQLSYDFLSSDVDFLMDYVQMSSEGYDLQTLAEKYHVPLKMARKRLNSLLQKAISLHLDAAYFGKAA